MVVSNKDLILWSLAAIVAGGALCCTYFIRRYLKSAIRKFNDQQSTDYTDRTVVRLHQATGAYHLNHGSLSPFCLKLEAFLKFANIPYETVNHMGNQGSPTGKIPFIEHDGRLLADSTDIIQYLESCLDDSTSELHAAASDTTAPVKFMSTRELTREQVARGHLIQSTLENHFYFFVLYQRYICSDDNYAYYVNLLFGSQNALVRWLIRHPFKNLLRNYLWNQVYAQGVARHSPERIVELARADLDAVGALLPPSGYLFSEDRLTVYDACVYGFLCNAIYGPDLKEDLGVKQYIHDEHPHMIDYVNRIRDEFFAHGSPQ